MTVKHAATPKLNKTNIAALERIRDRGPSAWCIGSRAGGATSRMFDLLTAQGYCSRPPHEITEKGRAAIKAAGVKEIK